MKCLVVCLLTSGGGGGTGGGGSAVVVVLGTFLDIYIGIALDFLSDLFLQVGVQY